LTTQTGFGVYDQEDDVTRYNVADKPLHRPALAALAVQMACTHTAAMAVLAKLDIAFASEKRVAAFGSAAARLMRAYATQVEVLRRLRHGGQQVVRVEHVHVNEGKQAVFGNVKKSDA
jgi:hypothetical protein